MSPEIVRLGASELYQRFGDIRDGSLRQEQTIVVSEAVLATTVYCFARGGRRLSLEPMDLTAFQINYPEMYEIMLGRGIKPGHGLGILLEVGRYHKSQGAYVVDDDPEEQSFLSLGADLRPQWFRGVADGDEVSVSTDTPDSATVKLIGQSLSALLLPWDIARGFGAFEDWVKHLKNPDFTALDREHRTKTGFHIYQSVVRKVGGQLHTFADMVQRCKIDQGQGRDVNAVRQICNALGR